MRSLIFLVDRNAASLSLSLCYVHCSDTDNGSAKSDPLASNTCENCSSMSHTVRSTKQGRLCSTCYQVSLPTIARQQKCVFSTPCSHILEMSLLTVPAANRHDEALFSVQKDICQGQRIVPHAAAFQSNKKSQEASERLAPRLRYIKD